MNVKLLRRIKRHILAEPKRLRMSTWLATRNDWTVLKGKFIFSHVSEWGEPGSQPVPKCGTVGCISGWARVLSGDEHGISRALLGLDDEQAERLFYVSAWPAKLMSKYVSAKTQLTRAKLCGERIDHFIATEGAE